MAQILKLHRTLQMRQHRRKVLLVLVVEWHLFPEQKDQRPIGIPERAEQKVVPGERPGKVLEEFRSEEGFRIYKLVADPDGRAPFPRRDRPNSRLAYRIDRREAAAIVLLERLKRLQRVREMPLSLAKEQRPPIDAKQTEEFASGRESVPAAGTSLVETSANR